LARRRFNACVAAHPFHGLFYNCQADAISFIDLSRMKRLESAKNALLVLSWPTKLLPSISDPVRLWLKDNMLWSSNPVRLPDGQIVGYKAGFVRSPGP